MNHKILFATVALALASAGTAVAQQSAATPDKPVRHMKLDTNNDGAKRPPRRAWPSVSTGPTRTRTAGWRATSCGTATAGTTAAIA